MKLQLRSLITSTHTKKTTYDQCKTYLQEADEDPNNSNNMILFYTGVSVTKSADMSIWNREHVWAQSLTNNWFGETGAGADLHHIRPTDVTVNTSRGNKKFGNVTDGDIVYMTTGDSSTPVAGESNTSYFEPNDNVKGDVARIIFYLFTRYTEADSRNFTDIAYSLDLLLEWNESDPVSINEINRNNYIYTIQGNRNPFIDNADYAEMIWG